MNELDALVNIDLKTRLLKNELTSLDIIRIGTSGAVQPDIGIDYYFSIFFWFGPGCFDALLFA